MRIEPIAIREIDIQPAIMVVVKEGQTASFGLDDGPFVIDAAPHIGNIQPSLLAHIHKLNRRCRWIRRRGSASNSESFHRQSGVASASSQCAAKHKQRDEPRKRRRGKIIRLRL